MREVPEMQMMQKKHGPNEHQSIIICINPDFFIFKCYPDEKIRNIRNSQKDNVNLLQMNPNKNPKPSAFQDYSFHGFLN